jgi:hypothetical protein
MGVDIVDIPPTLILPLRGGRKLFFLTQLGYYSTGQALSRQREREELLISIV